MIVDQDMAMDKLIGMICKTFQHHLRNIGNVTKFLDQGSAEILVHSFVLLSVPRFRTVTYGGRAFPIPGPRLWNELPDSLRKAADINAFKSQLKTHLVKKAYL